MKNYDHYNLDKQEPFIQQLANENKLTQPCFIGQGCTKCVGSDRYGYYIVTKKHVGRKVIWGIANANSVFGPEGWTAGSMYCSIDMSTAQPQRWIVAWGRTKAGAPKWWFCDENGKRCHGALCRYDWNGAYAYQDPSF